MEFIETITKEEFEIMLEEYLDELNEDVDESGFVDFVNSYISKNNITPFTILYVLDEHKVEETKEEINKAWVAKARAYLESIYKIK